MKNLKQDYFNPFFSHIYVEKDIINHKRTRRILEQFKQAQVIVIDHYKDVFCRKGQNYVKQQKAPSLILASKQGSLIYEGAKVCQSFGNEYFYYTSCVMNCIYDCEYCYLKGMYPSGNLVIFVNLEDYFEELEKILSGHSAYVCVSYDTDLMALEGVTEFVAEWGKFAKRQKSLRLEIRTKCGRTDLWEKLIPLNEVYYAFTLSPQPVIDSYEHGTASLGQRIASAKMALEKGFPVRLCFDPMIYCRDWRTHYHDMLTEIFEEIHMEKVTDVSIGSFRISQDYLKKMRKCQPDSAVVWFPYDNRNGVYQYPRRLMEEMEQFLVERIKEHMPEEKIFRWGKENE